MAQEIQVTTTTQVGDQPVKQTVTLVPTKNYFEERQKNCDYINLVVLGLIIIIGIIGFIKSIRSRKYFKCPVCGESFRSENMTPQTCKICGANLEETEDKNVTDKTK